MLMRNTMSSGFNLLDCTESIVKFSFRCHKSVTSLDLNIQEYAIFKKKRSNKMKFRGFSHVISSNYVCTEEGLQNSLQPRRRKLLYTYHLDLARVDSVLVYDVEPQRLFYVDKLFQFIEDAFRKNTEKLPVVKLCLRLMKHGDFKQYTFFREIVIKKYTANYLTYIILDTLHKECSDSELIVDVLNVYNFDRWIRYKSNPEQLEFFLRHLHRLRKGNQILKPDTISMCLANLQYGNVEVLFKYRGVVTLSSRSYERTVGELLR
ncbi:hypothetical protein AVEN_9031-1 [Araneus ventricosus]|uniref:Uncharacterized protein n=1 Tax=Araneus ventricosus TaxID=182803 RepID=A0A4Y2WYI1_ARAVE|nr:hypothetical protein AVEN_9031-1 [Araneus ventricosus]